MAIILKTPDQLPALKLAGRLAGDVLDYITPFVVAGTTTAQLDTLCHDFMVSVQGCIPAPLGYCPAGHSVPYPKSICASINHQICHGIPNDRPLKNGDIVNLDITVIKNGWHGDSSRMFVVGSAAPAARRLCEVTYAAMWHGIAAVKPGATLGHVGQAIAQYAHDHSYSVVREFCGHGIGQNFHEDPQVLHYGKAGEGETIVPGMVFTIEPMINAGRRDIRYMADGWTVVSKDHSLSAQWEHMVYVGTDEVHVLTLSPAAPLPPFALPPHIRTEVFALA